VPLFDSFARKAPVTKITQLSSVPTIEDLLYAINTVRAGSTIGLSWQIGSEKRVLFVAPATEGVETNWLLKRGEEGTAQTLWSYATNDTEAIHNVLVAEVETPAAVIPDELKHRPDSPTLQSGDPFSVKAGAGATHTRLEPGTVFGDRYEIISFVGAGGMGVVYKAKQLSMERIVALKVLHPALVSDPISKKRFGHEAKAASSLSHPNLIVVHDFGFSSSGQPFMVMDYLDGPTLHDLVDQSGPLAIDQFIDVFSQCCSGLGHAHKRGVIHRDVKPGNIAMTSGPDEPTNVVKLLDFGVAKVVNEVKLAGHQDMTNPGAIVGSPYFMSPEQCCGQEVDARTDIYSLGCVMYMSLTGALPFAGEDAVETMYMHIREPVPSFGMTRPDLDLPEEAEKIVHKALEKNPEKRYQNAEELAQDLDKLRSLLNTSEKVEQHE
jgi:tRNA A-37 threonylcarbamoyl transferase component Bud32